MRVSKLGFGWPLLAVVLILTGCSGARMMMPTPNVYLDSKRNYFADLARGLKSAEVPLFYVTDRAPEQDENGNLYYGYERSASLGFGTVVVDLGVDKTWDELLAASRTQRRLKPVELKLRDVVEIVRAPDTPLPFREVDGKIVEEPDLVAQREEAAEAFRSVMVRQLELTPRKEVFVYVHGFNNSFDDAAFAMAELWHFLGRIGVPIVYTWPAGYPGIFGYTYDRESSEFTVYHLREVLRLIASFPEVEKIHLIAHSRGTDVAVTAVRELTIAARAAGIDPRKKFKLHNIILAAPDLDLQVATQRILGDKIGLSTNRFTVYTSPKDKAIGFANTMFASPRGRLGSFGLDQLTGVARAAVKYNTGNLAFVKFSDAEGTSTSQGDGYGHSYFRNAPTVASDVVLILRDDLDPGTPGRPLEPIGPHFWQVPPGYPTVKPAPELGPSGRVAE
jgi:esterase/lipase superfamily enzyme